MFVNLGLVTGLKGTGDGADPPLIETAKSLLKDSASTKDYSNMALVSIVAIADANAQEGALVYEIQVFPVGPASSLTGGMLLETVLGDGSDDAFGIRVGGRLQPIFKGRRTVWRPETAVVRRSGTSGVPPAETLGRGK
jgi:flagellar basal body P-ring protein FlgI